MPKLNTTVKAVRIDNDILERLERRLEGKSFNAWMNEQIVSCLDSQKTDAKVGKPLFDMTELEDMAGCFGMSGEELLHGVVEGLNDGVLTVENGAVKGYTPWADEFEAVCHDLCIPVEKAAENAIKALRNGR